MPSTPESLAALPLSLAGHSVVVGLGATGLSCARFLSRMGASFSVVDSREAPPALSEFKALFPGADVYLGSLESAAITPVLEGADRLIVSPGVAVSSPAIARAKVKGVKILGDIALFAEFAPAPILAVTGSNGKSTVVALLAAMLRAAGKDFGLGGNLDGAQFKPALDLLEESPRSIYLLELSSFQLETTDELNAFAVALLNLSEDHMDRYSDSAEYLSAKQKIFCAAKHAVVNSGNPLTLPPSGTLKQLAYSVDGPANEGLGINEQGGERFLALNGESFLPVAELKQAGSHDLANALAATGLALLAGVSIEAVCAALRSFEGLPHRCEWLGEAGGISFYNDSKGTNVGAAVAALDSVYACLTAGSSRVVLIAGGEGKGANFAPLVPALGRCARALVLIGRDAERIADSVNAAVCDAENTGSKLQIVFAKSLPEAVRSAVDAAQSGDAVLLSPACASFDMFENFQDRGEQFAACVKTYTDAARVQQAGS